MNSTTSLPDRRSSFTLEYRLTEADVHQYCVSSRPGKCWGSCRKRRAAWLMLALLGFLLVGLCSQRKGIRAGSVILVASLAVLLVLTWSRQAWADHNVCRLARQMGLPRDLHLLISPEGILELPEDDAINPERTFGWSEVVDLRRIDGLTVVRVRPGGGVLIVPDRAFPSPESRSGFVDLVKGHLGTR